MDALTGALWDGRGQDRRRLSRYELEEARNQNS